MSVNNYYLWSRVKLPVVSGKFYKRSGIYFSGLFSFLLAILCKRSRVEVLSQWGCSRRGPGFISRASSLFSVEIIFKGSRVKLPLVTVVLEEGPKIYFLGPFALSLWRQYLSHERLI